MQIKTVTTTIAQWIITIKELELHLQLIGNY